MFLTGSGISPIRSSLRLPVHCPLLALLLLLLLGLLRSPLRLLFRHNYLNLPSLLLHVVVLLCAPALRLSAVAPNARPSFLLLPLS